ncbi:MAG: hypothetical protein OJF61_002221 [Rhodanobacteraceae bacterium]|jgi:hypothetical protein|nr:MAG: hypothetical protein OJF61_002221 [Rhodanobacteraceae bacterium]
MTHRLAPTWRAALLVGALLSLAACAATPAKAPDCHGRYTPINTPDHYPVSKKKAS